MLKQRKEGSSRVHLWIPTLPTRPTRRRSTQYFLSLISIVGLDHSSIGSFACASLPISHSAVGQIPSSLLKASTTPSHLSPPPQLIVALPTTTHTKHLTQHVKMGAALMQPDPWFSFCHLHHRRGAPHPALTSASEAQLISARPLTLCRAQTGRSRFTGSHST